MVTYNKKEYERLKNEIRNDFIKEIGICENCGYQKFSQLLELAHIRHGYQLENLRRSNLYMLCPTCHGEFDRGLISIHGNWSDSRFSHNYIEKAKMHKNEGYWETTSDGKKKFVCR